MLSGFGQQYVEPLEGEIAKSQMKSISDLIDDDCSAPDCLMGKISPVYSAQ